MQTVYAIHTTFALVEPLRPLFRELLPDVRAVHVADEGLLAEVREAGRPTPAVVRRMVGYAVLAQSSGANAILNCCSSASEVADLMQQAVDIPVVKIDEAMAREAVRIGNTAAIVATLSTTLEPTGRLLQRMAGLAGKQLRTTPVLVSGAFEALQSGDAEGHDRLLCEAIRQAAPGVDSIVLAQGSMARLVPHLQPELKVPLLSSPRSGVAELKRVLGA